MKILQYLRNYFFNKLCYLKMLLFCIYHRLGRLGIHSDLKLMSTHTQNPNHFLEPTKTNVSSKNVCSCNEPAPILEHSENITNESALPSQLDVRPKVVYLPVVKWNLKLQSNPNFPSGSFCTKVFQLDKKLNSISQRLKASAEEVERLATYTGKFFITNHTGNIINPLSANLIWWSNTLKKFVRYCQWIAWVCFTNIVGLPLKGSIT